MASYRGVVKIYATWLYRAEIITTPLLPPSKGTLISDLTSKGHWCPTSSESPDFVRDMTCCIQLTTPTVH